MTEPTNDELRRQLFELLGYKLRQGKRYWQIIVPGGRIITTDYARYSSPDSIFQYACVRYVPNWPEDLNAVAELLAQTGFMLWHNGGEWEVQDIAHGESGDGWSSRFSLPIIASHPNPARAICLAFVAMHEEQANE